MTRTAVRLAVVFGCVNLFGCSSSAPENEHATNLAIKPAHWWTCPPPQGLHCKDKQNPTCGEHDYKCVESTNAAISPESYCLRTTYRDATHVRLVKDGNTLIGDYNAEPKTSTTSGPCSYQKIPFLQVRDRIHILMEDQLLKMKIDNPDGTKNTYFDSPQELTAGPSNSDGYHYYWHVTTNGVDFFVMLADDERGDTHHSNVTRIEQYLRIEGFFHDDQDPSHAACVSERPDSPGGNGITNFHLWTPTPEDDACSGATMGTENGAGGGGHTYP